MSVEAAFVEADLIAVVRVRRFFNALIILVAAPVAAGRERPTGEARQPCVGRHSQLVALVVSPFCRAMSAAATRPAISAAIDDGDRPNCSSQRSVVAGPAAWTWFAIALIFWYVVLSVRPVIQASRIANESWSNCSQHPRSVGAVKTHH